MTRKILAALALATLMAAPAHAGPGGCGNGSSLFQIGDEGAGITVSSTALGLTATQYAPDGQTPAILAVCQVSTDNILVRADGRNPTATAGMIYGPTAAAGATFSVCGTANIRRTKVIRQTTDANLKCSYSREGDN